MMAELFFISSSISFSFIPELFYIQMMVVNGTNKFSLVFVKWQSNYYEMREVSPLFDICLLYLSLCGPFLTVVPTPQSVNINVIVCGFIKKRD